MQIVRAYSYFSHLSNIAEDQNQNSPDAARRHRQSTGRARHVGPRPRQCAGGRDYPAQLQDFFDNAFMVPVLTAHPTEVRRKSTMSREMAIAHLLERRDRQEWSPDEATEIEDKIRRAVLIFWQTSLLRRTKLNVRDEVSNGLAYYDYTFLQEVPRIYQTVERQVRAYDPSLEEAPIASFLRLGSWIGGDRDGNPYVDAEVVRTTTRMHGERILAFYLDELDKLGTELSVSAEIVEVTDELRELASSSPELSAAPDGGALSPRHRRPSAAGSRPISARSTSIIRSSAPREAMPAYHNADEFRRDLHIIDQSLKLHGSKLLTRGRLRALRRAASCFGFHLATLDLRQNSDVHERMIAELLDAVAPGTDYTSRTEDERVALLVEELNEVRPLISPFFSYSDETRKELAIFQAAVEARAALRRGGDPHEHYLEGGIVSDMLELAVILKEVGLVAPDGKSKIDIVPLFETIEDLRNCAAVMEKAFSPAGLSPPCRKPRRYAGDHARLFGQQQGWRLRHLRLGIVQGRDRPDRDFQEA